MFFIPIKCFSWLFLMLSLLETKSQPNTMYFTPSLFSFIKSLNVNTCSESLIKANVITY